MKRAALHIATYTCCEDNSISTIYSLSKVEKALPSAIPDPALLEKLLVETPMQMVKFKAYKRDGAPPTIDRRLTRVRNRNRMPLGAWAKWLVERILLHMEG